MGNSVEGLASDVITGDATHASEFGLPMLDYVLTSPPYWDMLHVKGAETQKKRRTSADLDVFYSDDPNDLGNLHDYEDFLNKLVAVYSGLKPLLQRESLPDHHRKKREKRRQDLSTCVGPGPRTRKDIYIEG